MYFWDITPANMATIADDLDGVIYPYLGFHQNTVDPTWLEPRLDAARGITDPAGLELVLLLYTGRFLDGIIHPTEDYVADSLNRAWPYLADGRITGVISYGAPVDVATQQASWDYWGRSGMGRLSLSVSNFVSTVDGSFAAATQTVAVDPAAPEKKLTFAHREQYDEGLTGYQFKQVLAGKSNVRLEFRFCTKNPVPSFEVEYGLDSLRTVGLDLANGEFESGYGWQLRSAGPITAAVDVAERCDTVVRGRHHGPLEVTGTTCLRGATVTGPVTVRPGGTLHADGGRLEGSLAASGAKSVVLTGTRITGAVDISRTTEVGLDHVTVDGSVQVRDNRTGLTPIRIAGNTVRGALSCGGNTPAPYDDAIPNHVRGATSGQCTRL